MEALAVLLLYALKSSLYYFLTLDLYYFLTPPNTTQNCISTSPVNEEDKHFAEEEIYDEGLIEDPHLSHWNEPDYDHEYLRTWFLVNVKGSTWVEKYQGEISLVFQNLLRYRFWSIPDLLRLRYSTEADIELIADYSLGDKK